MSGAILCPSCGEESFLRREPVYEGFQKIGESLSCVSCGHTFASEEDVAFVHNKGPQIFTNEDRTETFSVFSSDEAGHNCRHCMHYLKNPFIQRCGLHLVEVQATDCCKDFQKKSTDAGG